jgi:hypothetical protein
LRKRLKRERRVDVRNVFRFLISMSSSYLNCFELKFIFIYVLRRLVFKIHVTVKWRKVGILHDKSVDVSYLHMQHVNGTIIWKESRALRIGLQIHLIFKKYFEDPRLRHTQFSCNIA